MTAAGTGKDRERERLGNREIRRERKIGREIEKETGKKRVGETNYKRKMGRED